MLISYDYQFLFIHVPKAAGTSIEQAVDCYAHHAENDWINRALAAVGIHVNHLGHYRSKLFRKHATADQVRSQLPASVYRNLFKFAFVRNPWDLMVSLYHFLLQTPGHHRHRRVKRLGSLEAYLEYEVRRSKFSQRQFLADRAGTLLVDFLGRFESLEEDFASVCRTLGIPAQLPHTNRSWHKDYRSYYNDRSAELVARHFRDDIELLGYDFDRDARDRRAYKGLQALRAA